MHMRKNTSAFTKSLTFTFKKTECYCVSIVYKSVILLVCLFFLINRSKTSIFISILLLTNFCESESKQKYTYLLKNKWAKLYWNFKSCFVLLFRFNSVLILNSNAVTQKKYKIYVFWYIIWFVIWHAWKQNDTQNIQYKP